MNCCLESFRSCRWIELAHVDVQGTEVATVALTDVRGSAVAAVPILMCGVPPSQRRALTDVRATDTGYGH